MTARIVRHAQGSEKWHDWRATGIGGSDAPVIMGVSPYRTPFDLWQSKTGRTKDEPNGAMLRGINLEPIARKAYEDRTGRIMQPVCLESIERPWMRGSLDGAEIDLSLILEIKCPGQNDHATARAGKVPEHYRPQVQHLLAVSGAKCLHYWSFDGADGVLVEVEPDADYIAGMIERELAFFENHIKADTPPPMNERDTVLRSDEQWIAAAARYRNLSRIAEQAEIAASEARDELIRLAADQSSAGAGIKASRYFRAGAVDYKKVPQLKGVDLEPYRKAGAWQWRVSVDEDAA